MSTQEGGEAYRGDTIVELGSRRDTWVWPLSSWVREQQGKTICRECTKLKRSVYPRVVDVFLHDRPRRVSCGGVFHAGFGIIHAKLLEVLGPHLKDAILGGCFDRNGEAIADYRSIYMRQRIRIRADANANCYSHWECKVCGSEGELSEYQYVLRSELPSADIFEDTTARLYLSEASAADFPLAKFRDLKPIAMRVLDAPPAGESGASKGSGRSAGGFAGATAGQPSRSSEPTMSAEALFARLAPKDAVLVCEDSCGRERGEYDVPVRTLFDDGAGPKKLETLRQLLGDMPHAASWQKLYAKHNGIGLFSPMDEEEPAIILLPIELWLEQKDKMFEWFFEGVEEAFEDLPYGPDDVLPIAALSYSPDRWFLVTSGPNAGMVHFWGHEDSPMEETPFAETLPAFIKRLTEENAPEYFGDLVRFKASQARDPKPAHDVELYPVCYEVRKGSPGKG